MLRVFITISLNCTRYFHFSFIFFWFLSHIIGVRYTYLSLLPLPIAKHIFVYSIFFFTFPTLFHPLILWLTPFLIFFHSYFTYLFDYIFIALVYLGYFVVIVVRLLFFHILSLYFEPETRPS